MQPGVELLSAFDGALENKNKNLYAAIVTEGWREHEIRVTSTPQLKRNSDQFRQSSEPSLKQGELSRCRFVVILCFFAEAQDNDIESTGKQ
jgi:hypothetical protein